MPILFFHLTFQITFRREHAYFILSSQFSNQYVGMQLVTLEIGQELSVRKYTFNFPDIQQTAIVLRVLSSRTTRATVELDSHRNSKVDENKKVGPSFESCCNKESHQREFLVHLPCWSSTTPNRCRS